MASDTSSDQSRAQDKPREHERTAFEERVEALAEVYYESCRKLARTIKRLKKKKEAGD